MIRASSPFSIPLGAIPYGPRRPRRRIDLIILRRYDSIRRLHPFQIHIVSYSHGLGLADFSAAVNPGEYRLLLGVVQVRCDGKLTLPVRELWYADPDEEGDIEYLICSANSADDGDDTQATLEEANHAISRAERPWFRSLDRYSPQGAAADGRWYVTVLADTEPSSIWTWKAECRCYVLDEDALRIWLGKGGGTAERFDDEDGWGCLTDCSSGEEDGGASTLESG
jgi:hypothetical protein